MSNVVENLEALAEKAQPRPWRLAPEGKPQDTVLTDDPGQSADKAEDVQYYGGYIVAESVTRPARELIVAAVNALPDLLRLARAAEKASDVLLKLDREFEYLRHAELDVALEPLFREEPTDGR